MLYGKFGRSYWAVNTNASLLSSHEDSVLFLQCPKSGPLRIQNSCAWYKLRGYDFRDLVWTLFPLKGRRKCTPWGPSSPPSLFRSLVRSLAHAAFPLYSISLQRLSTTHLMKVNRESSTEFSAQISRPREKFNMHLPHACQSRRVQKSYSPRVKTVIQWRKSKCIYKARARSRKRWSLKLQAAEK